MAWLAVDKNGEEVIFGGLPLRGKEAWNVDYDNFNTSYIDLPIGTIEKILNRKITWEDEPVIL